MGALVKYARGQLVEGRFELLEEIGRGGMATVYKAADLEENGQLVAVKVPLPQFSSGVGSWSMFQREADIGASLKHAYIVRFIATRPRKQRSVVVTEYIDGTTLYARLLHEGYLSEPEALKIMSRLCEAVDYMHRQGVVHYDLKPANVLLLRDGTIRLIDFGMAHEVVEHRLAFAGAAPPIASAYYVAPEQLRRRRGQRSVDIYALGAMLYEMLTGHPPFEGDDPFVIASARQIGDPRAPRALNPHVSAVAEEIVLRAMRRNPAERYLRVADLKADLDEPSRVHVSGLSEHLIEVTAARRYLRLLRFVTLTAFVPIAVLVGMFRLLWWWLERKH